MAIVGNKKVSTSLIVLAACVVGVGLGLFGLNYWHAMKCTNQHSSDEIEEHVEALNRRLLESESKLIHNQILLNKLIAKIQNNLIKLEATEFEEITRESKDEAVKVALFLASHPAPPMPDFSLDSNYFDPEKLADVIDDVFGRPENSNSNKEYSALDRFTDDKEYLEEQPSKETPLISDAEASKTCTEWKDKYNVVVGVSWGDLPYDLQQKWLEYSCDYHLEREDDDKQENGVEEQGEKDGSEEDKVADVAGLPTFDDREELPNVR